MLTFVNGGGLADVELAIQDAAKLAPLHNPANLLGIREARC